MGELNLQAHAQHWETSVAACKRLPSSADLATTWNSQPYVKPEFMAPQHRGDRKHPDAMIKDFWALLNNSQHAMHHGALYSGTQVFLKHKSRNETYMLDEQLHSMELCIYHGFEVQVEGSGGERISQMCRCTRCQSLRVGDRRNDWVWGKQHPGRCYEALNGRVPWQLQRLFRIKLLTEDGAFVEYWLSLALTTLPENSGNLDPVSQIVPVRKSLAALALKVFSVGNIVGCLHVIAVIATSCNTGDGRNEWWIVNSHIDLATWNDV